MLEKATQTNQTGNSNISVNGNGNCLRQQNNTNNGSISVYQLPERLSLSKTLIYDLLNKILKDQPDFEVPYSLELPSGINEKLKFNNAHRYAEISEEYSDDYAQLDDVMKDFPGGTKIVKMLHYMFIKVAALNPDGTIAPCNGDDQLDTMREELISKIKNDYRFNEEPPCDEDIDQFVIALMVYGISKCKVLVTPEKG